MASILKSKIAFDKKITPTYRIININNGKYLKRTEFKNNQLLHIDWTKDVNDAHLFGDLLIQPVMSFLRKEKHIMVTYESTKLTKYQLARKAHIEHVEKNVKRIIREKRSLAELVDAKNVIGKNEVITNDLRRAINDL
jgi:hypothetical protein